MAPGNAIHAPNFSSKQREIDRGVQFLHCAAPSTSQIQHAGRTSQFTSDFSIRLDSLVHGDFSVRPDLSILRPSQFAELPSSIGLLISDWTAPCLLEFFLFVWKIRSPACRIPARDQAEAKREAFDERRSETVVVFRVFHYLAGRLRHC
jgi:hypothetical protein